MDPRSEDVSIADMAHSLSLKVRFTGQCKNLYTVGIHSLRVATVAAILGVNAGLDEDLCSDYGLSHDLAEYITSDIPSPIKGFIAGWREIEDSVEAEIFKHLYLPPMTPAIKKVVKTADIMLLKLETEELFPNVPEDAWTSLKDIEIPDSIRAAVRHYPIDVAIVEDRLSDGLREVKASNHSKRTM